MQDYLLQNLPSKSKAELGAPQQADDGVLGVRRVCLREATTLCKVISYKSCPQKAKQS